MSGRPLDDNLLLRVRGLRKAFGGVRAVDGVSLGLRRGEVRALIGPNGAGKTTVFNCLTGYLRRDGGSVAFKGEEIGDLPPHVIWRKGISRTFQIPATFSSLTVVENVQVALLSHEARILDLWRPARPLARERALDLVAMVGLKEQATQGSGFLAYGDVKRLELAIALANDPELLLLDEPTAGMAPTERAELLALVQRIVDRRGLAILFTEHDMEAVFSVAQTVMVMHQGRVLAEGKPEEIRANEEVQRIYLGEG